MEDYRVTQTGDEIQEILNQSPIDTADIAELKEAATSLDGRLESVEVKIPAGASEDNPLTDKQYVDDSIASASATFRGTYNEVTDLELTTDATHADIGSALDEAIELADSNDYCFVQIPTDDETPTEIESIERYKFVTGTGWEYEYTLNNSGFTADQWSAINSGITSGLVTKISDLPTNAELATLLNGKANAADVYTKSETYNKTELDSMITTPDVQYVSVTATAQTTAVTDVLPATGAADTVYRVGSWDGTQYDANSYSEYAWNGTAYVILNVKNTGIATGSDFDNPTAAQRELLTTVGAVLDGCDAVPTAGSAKPVQSGGVAYSLKNREFDFDSGFVGCLNSGGNIATSFSNFNTLGYIPVNEGDKFIYKGYVGSEYRLCCFYDSDKTLVDSIPGSNKTIVTEITIPNNVSFIRVSAANSGHASYNGRFLYRTDLIGLNEFSSKGGSIVFNNNRILNLDGTLSSSDVANTSDYIPVNEGDALLYMGYISNSYASIVGYDDNHANPTVLAQAAYNIPFVINIPNGVAYIRVCGANSSHSNYKGRYCYIISSKYYRYYTDDIENRLNALTNNVNNVNDNLEEIDEEIFVTEKVNLSFRRASSLVQTVWSQFTSVGAQTYYIKTTPIPNDIKLYSGYGVDTTLVRTFASSEIVTINDDLCKIIITDDDITNGANWLRINGSVYANFEEIYVLQTISRISELEQEAKSPLYGKKVAIIGDSISTIYGNNTPYFTIQDSDVGNEIQSYISYIDVYGTDTTDPQPLGTTIGGVPLTGEMIGTLQTFTPVAEDVGKSLGKAYNYNPESTKVWSQVLCEKTGAVLLANASYSGASMCSGQSGIWNSTHAYHPMTIGRCRTRDAEGNYINPDVIIIYRGTNDLSHKQGGTYYSQLDDYDLFGGYPESDVYEDNGVTLYGFRRAYYKTIGALRAAYPEAIIYICTLNVFKRIKYDRYPTRNGSTKSSTCYTLPDMNDVIRDIANKTGCGIIEFDKDGITFENCYSEGYITDSSTQPTHPNSKGHEVMARKAIEDLKHIL